MNIKFALCIAGLLILALPFNAFAQPADGACCTVEEGCQLLSSAACGQVAGAFLGEGITCGPPDPCQAQPMNVPIPTLTEWGMIIFIALAGLGVVSYMRRQKRANN